MQVSFNCRKNKLQIKKKNYLIEFVDLLSYKILKMVAKLDNHGPLWDCEVLHMFSLCKTFLLLDNFTLSVKYLLSK